MNRFALLSTRVSGAMESGSAAPWASPGVSWVGIIDRPQRYIRWGESTAMDRIHRGSIASAATIIRRWHASERAPSNRTRAAFRARRNTGIVGVHETRYTKC